MKTIQLAAAQDLARRNKKESRASEQGATIARDGKVYAMRVAKEATISANAPRVIVLFGKFTLAPPSIFNIYISFGSSSLAINLPVEIFIGSRSIRAKERLSVLPKKFSRKIWFNCFLATTAK